MTPWGAAVGVSILQMVSASYKINWSLILVLTVLSYSSCNRSNHAKSSTTPQAGGASGGEEIAGEQDPVSQAPPRTAAQMPALPAELHATFQVLQKYVAGDAVDVKSMSAALDSLAVSRNEETCRMGIFLMKAMESELPGQLPPLDAFGDVERQMHAGTFPSSPLRHGFVLMSIVRILTEFDMATADREVAGFLKRFEEKYRDSEAGQFFLERYREQRATATESRELGSARWMQGKSGYIQE